MSDDSASDQVQGRTRSKTTSQKAHAQRVVDFIFLVAASLTVLAGIWLVGEMTAMAAVIAGVVVVLFAIIYLNGTSDIVGASLADEEAAETEERLLRASSERGFRAAMINALPEPAMYIDAHGRVETANDSARREFRFVAPSPLLSMVVRRSELLESVAAVRREKRAKLFELVMRDETDRYFAGVAAPVSTHDSQGVLVTLHDLTQIKRSELARVDFLANASHELRTPLTSLAGFIETLKGSARDDPEARARFLDIMESQAQRMGGLINDLMSLSRIELNEHRPPETTVDLASIVGEVCDALMPVAHAREVTLVYDGPAYGLEVVGVPDELTQVVQNLIDNAIKYSDAGKSVRISLGSGLALGEAVRRAGRQWDECGRMSIVAAVSSTRGKFACLRVSDSGPGIPRQHLPRLAERFYRVDQGRGLQPGTGLGLAIVKHIVTRHRGEFLVESDVGRGAAFGVVLAQPAEATNPDSSQGSERANQPRLAAPGDAGRD